ncbi:hypothetical protein EJ04DRAFT_522225 [Polyplosphaeria fusca]|uniref:Uncharacterized protein n=1 Tax=Polyplosphaeria fusca TaxID=682080 RepID=A0A9P4R3A1_9PLEO|nr:hypothetical protein EJ04DRAFT_522225 [Polyplosphaeria fusca]
MEIHATISISSAVVMLQGTSGSSNSYAYGTISPMEGGGKEKDESYGGEKTSYPSMLSTPTPYQPMSTSTSSQPMPASNSSQPESQYPYPVTVIPYRKLCRLYDPGHQPNPTRISQPALKFRSITCAEWKNWAKGKRRHRKAKHVFERNPDLQCQNCPEWFNSYAQKSPTTERRRQRGYP